MEKIRELIAAANAGCGCPYGNEKACEDCGIATKICSEEVQRLHELLVDADLLSEIEQAGQSQSALLQAKLRYEAAEFWRDWVFPEGANPEQIKAELSDYLWLIDAASKVYCELTGSRISKPNTLPDVVIDVARDVQEEECKEAIAEATEELREDLVTALGLLVDADGMEITNWVSCLLTTFLEVLPMAEQAGYGIEDPDAFRMMQDRVDEWVKRVRPRISVDVISGKASLVPQE